MKDKSKSAKFFCESCGAEVAANAKFCNVCGKFFSSVRCPNCGKTGSTKQFEEGCPDCGYAVGKPNGGFSNIQNKGIINSKFNNSKNLNAKSTNSDSLPLWMYILSIGALLVIIFCIFTCLK